MRICVARHSPSNDPKFHHTEMLEGAGRSTTASLAILSRGWVFRRLAIRVFIVELQRWFFESLVLVKIQVKIMSYLFCM